MNRRWVQFRPPFAPATGLPRAQARTHPRPSNHRVNKANGERRRNPEERLSAITGNILGLRLKPRGTQQALSVALEFFIRGMAGLDYNLACPPLRKVPMIREREEEESGSTANFQDTRVVAVRSGELEKGFLDRIQRLRLTAPETSHPVTNSCDLVCPDTAEKSTAPADTEMDVEPEPPIREL